MHACSGFVHCVYGLVGEAAVGYVTVCQFDTRKQCFVGICDIMVVLVTLLDVLEDCVCVLGRCGLYKHLLETAFKGSVLFYCLAVFIDCGGSNALYLASCKSRLEDVRGIH